MKRHTKVLVGTGLIMALAWVPFVGSRLYNEAKYEIVVLEEDLPLASNIDIYEKSGTIMDFSNTKEGYVTVSNTTAKKRLKVQVIKNNTTYNYDLKNGGKAEIYPFQLGEGQYKVRVLENTTGNKYTPLAEKTIDVKLDSAFTPFLKPSQYIMYGNNWAAVKKAAELTKGKKTDQEKIEAIYTFVVKSIKYDYKKAETVKAGYLPNVDETLASKKGICFDYAALLSAMLRSQGIPSRMIIGTVSPKDINHAWNEVYTDKDGWTTIKIEFKGNQWNRMDSTFGASGGDDIQKFIGNGQNYTGLRLY